MRPSIQIIAHLFCICKVCARLRTQSHSAAAHSTQLTVYCTCTCTGPICPLLLILLLYIRGLGGGLYADYEIIKYADYRKFEDQGGEIAKCVEMSVRER